ncbi:MAG: hypothetical protein WC696_00380 [Candidatus Methylopumilus sp.]|jgi:hypothetical protein
MSQDSQQSGNSSDSKITREVRISNSEVSEESLHQIKSDMPRSCKIQILLHQDP